MAQNDRIKIDDGEIRYTFSVQRHRPFINAEFRGPQLGTAFEMSLEDAERMRDDLEVAIAAYLGRWGR